MTSIKMVQTTCSQYSWLSNLTRFTFKKKSTTDTCFFFKQLCRIAVSLFEFKSWATPRKLSSYGLKHSRTTDKSMVFFVGRTQCKSNYHTITTAPQSTVMICNSPYGNKQACKFLWNSPLKCISSCTYKLKWQTDRMKTICLP